MAENSKIEWTNHSFNPWRGCSKISAGCANCYAETLSGRNPGTLGVWGPNGTRVVASEAMWREPVKWDCAAKSAGERHRVFCASLGDVFEDWTGPMVDAKGKELFVSPGTGLWLPGDFQFMRDNLTMDHVRARLFALIDATPNLDWLLLTKRPENIARMMPKPAFDHAGWNGTLDGYWHQMDKPRPNVWLGVSVENQQAADERIPHLLKVPAKVRSLSCEPLLGPVDIEWWLNEAKFNADDPNVPKLHWVIVGGESGPGARPLHPDWARSLRDQCQAAGVPFFFKQHGDWLAHAVLEDGPKKVRFEPPLGCGDMGSLHIIENGQPVKPPKGATVNEIMAPGRILLTRPGKKAAGRMLDGRTWDEFPAVGR